MNKINEPTRTAPEIPPGLRNEAQHFIRALSHAAGDPDATYALLQSYCYGRGHEDATAVLAAVVLLLFAEPATAAGAFDAEAPSTDTEGAI